MQDSDERIREGEHYGRGRTLAAEWLDQDVAVIISGEQTVRVIGRLEGVSDWGTSLAVPLDDEGEGAETTVFYPWHRVESVRLAREDEQSG